MEMISVPCDVAKGIADLRASREDTQCAQSFELPSITLDQRLLKLEDTENNAINLCHSLYDKDRETKYISLSSFRRIFEQKRDFSQLIYDLVGY